MSNSLYLAIRYALDHEMEVHLSKTKPHGDTRLRVCHIGCEGGWEEETICSAGVMAQDDDPGGLLGHGIMRQVRLIQKYLTEEPEKR